MRIMVSLSRNMDAQAVAALALIWLLFFWRLFTPVAADQASLAEGDFSGQFVAFAGYQYQRMSQGEIPLWNPYNNAGLPFVGDTQAAVFYPPRWLSMGLSKLGGGYSYNTLQMEMAAHVLLGTLLMYLFMRRISLGDARSPLAAFCSAVIVGYGGYTSGYPLLQLAVLESAIWLPLAALGILEATRGRSLNIYGIALASLGLALSWLGGHSQTSFFISYVAAGYLAFRCLRLQNRWRSLTLGMVLFAALTLGLYAVSLLPGLEYLLLTTRETMGFAAKGNGFPIRDIAQFVLPGAVSQWSPLFVGLPALFFVAVAGSSGWRESRFWLLVACIALVHSLGENSAFYSLTYNIVPGLRFFRGQERAAMVVAHSLAILAGLGVVRAASWQNQHYRQLALRYWGVLAGLLAALALGLFLAWQVAGGAWSEIANIAIRSATVALAAYAILRRWLAQPSRIAPQLALACLIVFELFSVNMDHAAVFVSTPHDEALSMSPPPLVAQVLADDSQQPFRVDGYRGLRDNYGSLHGLMDIRGISPLWLKGPELLIYADYADHPLSWELFAVKYVFSGQDSLSAPSQVIATGRDKWGDVWLHRLDDPRPFVRLYYEADVVNTDQWAVELMGDIRYHERDRIVLQQAPELELDGQPSTGSASVRSFAPEEVVIDIDASANAVLSISMPEYPGWQARLDGQPVRIIRAYASLMAVESTGGQAYARPDFRAYQLHNRRNHQRFSLAGAGIAIHARAPGANKARLSHALCQCPDTVVQPAGEPQLCPRAGLGAGLGRRWHRSAGGRAGSALGAGGDRGRLGCPLYHHGCQHGALRHYRHGAAAAIWHLPGQDRPDADLA